MIFSFSAPETDLINEINKQRAAYGVRELVMNHEASRLARYRSEEMVALEFFGHSSRIYGEPDEMLLRFGVPFASLGINIAMGQENASEVLNAWLSSAPHRENLLNENFTSVGVGLAFDEDIPYWTLILISSA
jgi:uncharacterized protein YkwD